MRKIRQKDLSMNNFDPRELPFYGLVLALVVALAMLAGSLFNVATANAADFKTGMITVKEPWARGTPRSGGAFMMIHNMGPADELVAVRADVAKKVQTHKTVSENGIMKMKHVHAIPVPAKGMVMLKPGSFHVMMMGLNKPLKPGSHFPLTLVFKNAGELKVMVEVRKLGARMPAKMDHKMDDKKKN
jgi:periplasmic copper chaperone A